MTGTKGTHTPKIPALRKSRDLYFRGGYLFVRQLCFCGAIGCYSAGGVHRSLLPPEELLPPLSGAGVVTRGVWRRVVEAA